MEAIVDIDCDFAPAFDIQAVQEPAKAAYVDRYPTVRNRFLREVTIQQKAEGEIDPSFRQGLRGYMYLQEDGKQLIQVRTNGFSFNRLAPYSSFDDYLPEIIRTWGLFRDVTKPVQVNVIRLRYINRIELPITDGKVELEDFFKVAPKLPEEDRLSFTGFLNRYDAVEDDTGFQVSVVLATEPPQAHLRPLIFDNAATAVNPIDPSDLSRIEAILRALRALKNRVFRNTLSEQCLELFQ